MCVCVCVCVHIGIYAHVYEYIYTYIYIYIYIYIYNTYVYIYICIHMFMCIILEGVRAKNIQATLLFVDFTKAFDSVHRGKMEQILLAYGLPKETAAAITILYRNTKVKVSSPNGDTEYFDIVAGVLQGNTLAPYLFTICQDYVLRTSIDKIRETASSCQRKVAEGTPQKRLPTPTTPMTERYWQIHPTKTKHYCRVWNEQLQA